jgi:hypothetical protein
MRALRPSNERPLLRCASREYEGGIKRIDAFGSEGRRDVLLMALPRGPEGAYQPESQASEKRVPERQRGDR